MKDRGMKSGIKTPEVASSPNLAHPNIRSLLDAPLNWSIIIYDLKNFHAWQKKATTERQATCRVERVRQRRVRAIKEIDDRIAMYSCRDA